MQLAKSTIGDAGSVLNSVAGKTGVSQSSIGHIVGQITQVFLALIGIILVVLIIYSGFLWMTSGGNEEKVGRAKKTIMSSVIGVFIVLSTYAITAFVIGALK